MTDDDKEFGCAVIVMVALFFGMMGICVSHKWTDSAWREEAVRENYAEYVPDIVGKPEWRWKKHVVEKPEK